MLVAYNDDSEGLMNEVRQFLEEREMSDLQKKQHLCATPLQARLDLPLVGWRWGVGSYNQWNERVFMKIQEQILGKADRSRSFHASNGALSRAAAAQLESTTSKDIARMRTELFNKFLEMSNKKHCLYRCVHAAKPPLHAWPVSAAAILWRRDIIIESEYDPMVNHAKAIKYTHYGLRVPPGHALPSSALLSDWHGRYQLHDSEDPLKKDWLKMMDERSMTASAAQRKQACTHCTSACPCCSMAFFNVALDAGNQVQDEGHV
jgi:hypothetical protein